MKSAHNEISAADQETFATTAVGVATRRVSAANNNNNCGDDFARAFANHMCSYQQEFSAQAQFMSEARRQETGDAGGANEDHIYVSQGATMCTQMAPNHGQTFRIEQQHFGRDHQEAKNSPNSNDSLATA